MAIKGYGATFGRGDGASPESFTDIAQVINIIPPQLSRETIDTTHLESADGYNEYIPGMREGGEVTFTLGYEKNGTGQSDIRGDFDSDANVNYKVTYPNGATWEFTGFVTGLSPSEVANNERVTESVTIKVTGKPTWTEAA